VATKVQKATKATRVTRVTRETRESLEILDRLVTKVQLDNRVHQVIKEFLDHQEKKVRKVHQAL
jgi:hypothetical protein